MLGLWGFALVPSYLVVRKVGIDHVGAEGILPEVVRSASVREGQDLVSEKM